MGEKVTDEIKTLIAILTLEGKRVRDCPFSTGPHGAKSPHLFSYTNFFGHERIIVPCVNHLPYVEECNRVYKEIKSVEDLE
jgi:hypothetical protein